MFGDNNGDIDKKVFYFVLILCLYYFIFYTYLYLQASSPSSGTFTALGVYLLTGLLFVVGSFLEFALVLSLKQRWNQTRLVNYNMLPSQGNQANKTLWETR